MRFGVEVGILVRQEVCSNVSDVVIVLQATAMLLTVGAVPKKVTFLFSAEADLSGAVVGTKKRRTAHPRRSVTL